MQAINISVYHNFYQFARNFISVVFFIIFHSSFKTPYWSVLPAKPWNAANEECLAHANCLGMKLALWKAGAVSNSSEPPAGAFDTTGVDYFYHFVISRFIF